VILRARFNPTWLPDNHSFVYTQQQELPPGVPVAEILQKTRVYVVYVHVLGAGAEKDIPVFGHGVVPTIRVDGFPSVGLQPDANYAIGTIFPGISASGAQSLLRPPILAKPTPSGARSRIFQTV
jgi:hypothetical protein